MHIAMIIDNGRLMQEHAMLKRLCIGMLDRGVRLTRIVPERIDSEAVLASERRLALVPRLRTRLKVLPWVRAGRTAELASAMERALPDAIYAVGADTWALALDLADAIDRPIALDVWSAALAQAAPRKRAAKQIGGYIVPTAPLADLLRQRVDSDLVSHVPMGAAIGSTPQRAFADKQQAVSAAIVGSGRDLPAYRHLLEALRRIVRDVPQLQIVLELRGPHEHDIWREVGRQGLHHAVSPIRDTSLHRPLITQCDTLIMPECLGEASSLLLECMAAGMAIIAREDPMLDVLEHGKSGLLLAGDDAQRWDDPLARCLGDALYARNLGRNAREVAVRSHSSSIHIARLLATIERIVKGESYAFAPLLPSA